MPVSAQNTPAALAPSSPVVWLCLLHIWVSGQEANVLRVVNNSEAVDSRGMHFEPYPFTVELPTDDSESLPSVSLVISNLDAVIVEFIRGQETAPNIAIELVTSAYPDLVEKSLTFLKLVSVTYDAMTVSGRLDVDDFLSQRFPGEGYVPSLFPALFR
jgi:Domain of unknown function (DUF1833)